MVKHLPLSSHPFLQPNSATCQIASADSRTWMCWNSVIIYESWITARYVAQYRGNQSFSSILRLLLGQALFRRTTKICLFQPLLARSKHVKTSRWDGIHWTKIVASISKRIRHCGKSSKSSVTSARTVGFPDCLEMVYQWKRSSKRLEILIRTLAGSRVVTTSISTTALDNIDLREDLLLEARKLLLSPGNIVERVCYQVSVFLHSPLQNTPLRRLNTLC